MYYKTLGDGSSPVILMNLHFNATDVDGDNFISLFSEKKYCIKDIFVFKNERVAKIVFEAKVNELQSMITSAEFGEEVKALIGKYLQGKGADKVVVENVMEKLSVHISLETEIKNSNEELTNVSIPNEMDSYIKLDEKESRKDMHIT